jgi:hypothetical protein
MGVFFSILMNFFVSLFGVYSITLAVRIAMTLSFIALVVAAIYAYMTAASVLINGIAQTVPDVVNGVWGWVMPPNTNVCFVAIGSVFMLRFFTNQFFLLLNAKFRAIVTK